MDKTNICTECIGGREFSQWIADNGKKGKCDFNKHHGKNNYVSDIVDFSTYVAEYFQERYQFGEEYVYAIEESDNPQRGTHGEPYMDILSELLECDEDVLEAVNSHLPDDADISSGEEPFFDESANYEFIENAVDRQIMEQEERDYYEIEAALSNQEPLKNLKENLDLLLQLLEEKEHFLPNLQKFQLMMVFSFSITSLESYLSDTFARSVLNDNELKKKYLNSEKSLKKEKILLSEIFDKYFNIDNKIKDKIQNTTFHNLGTAKKLYKAVLDIDLGNISTLIKLVNKRHNFVHRGGKDKDGTEVLTNKTEVMDMINTINKMCLKIENELKLREESKKEELWNF